MSEEGSISISTDAVVGIVVGGVVIGLIILIIVGTLFFFWALNRWGKYVWKYHICRVVVVCLLLLNAEISCGNGLSRCLSFNSWLI